MTKRLHNKKVLVTAAGQGIGRAIVEAFISEGAEVIATDVDEKKLKGLEAECHKLDVCNTKDVEGLKEKIGAVNVLVNVAGYVHHGSILECSEKDWDCSFDLNVKAMHRTIKTFLPDMLKQAQNGNLGAIVNMASAVGSIKGTVNRYAYGASKAAVIGLTKSIAADFVSKGVRCNAICPGTVKSPSWEERVQKLGEEMGSYEEALESFVSRQPMGRVGEANEIASLALYLASDESRFVTGTTMLIDGGWTV